MTKPLENSFSKTLTTDANNCTRALDNHKQRVEWQIRRIYRARNMIVHDGTTPSYTNILIENLHDYLDSVMKGLMLLASTKHTMNTIGQGFKIYELNNKSFLNGLNKIQKGFTNDTFNKLGATLLIPE